jgi:hypothetical protein
MQVCVTQNSEEPGFHPSFVTQLPQLGLGRAKSLLRKVLCIDCVAREPIGVAIQGRVMVVDQLRNEPLSAGQCHVDNLYNNDPGKTILFPVCRGSKFFRE